jgi:hypothetical protein
MPESKVRKVKIADLKFDKDNPNKLTEEHTHALQFSIDLIADGEHRILS